MQELGDTAVELHQLVVAGVLYSWAELQQLSLEMGSSEFRGLIAHKQRWSQNRKVQDRDSNQVDRDQVGQNRTLWSKTKT